MTKGRILIVEDDVALQGEILKFQLEDEGYEVIGIAPTVKEALEMFDSGKPDLVLMDVWLPMDVGGDLDREGGIKAAREILKSGLPGLIFMTAKDVPNDLLQQVLRTSPTAQFLTKEIQKRQLITAVELALLRAHDKRRIFLCYAHEDSVLKDEMLRFLLPLKRCGVETWHDADIGLGDRWKIQIEAAIRAADAAILFISIDFINSRFVQEVELPRLLAAESANGLRVIPIFVGAVPGAVLERHGLLTFQALNSPTTPLNTWLPARRELEAWTPLCDRLFQIMPT